MRGSVNIPARMSCVLVARFLSPLPVFPLFSESRLSELPVSGSALRSLALRKYSANPYRIEKKICFSYEHNDTNSVYKLCMSNELIQISPPLECSDSENSASTPFSRQFVTLSKQEHIQLKCDVNRWRVLAQQWKDKCFHLEQSQQDHETRVYLKLLENRRRQTEELERSQARVLQLEKQVNAKTSV